MKKCVSNRLSRLRGVIQFPQKRREDSAGLAGGNDAVESRDSESCLNRSMKAGPEL